MTNGKKIAELIKYGEYHPSKKKSPLCNCLDIDDKDAILTLFANEIEELELSLEAINQEISDPSLRDEFLSIIEHGKHEVENDINAIWSLEKRVRATPSC